jgi:hypothetical protein
LKAEELNATGFPFPVLATPLYVSNDGLTALADIDILHHDALLSVLPKLP